MRTIACAHNVFSIYKHHKNDGFILIKYNQKKWLNNWYIVWLETLQSQIKDPSMTASEMDIITQTHKEAIIKNE